MVNVLRLLTALPLLSTWGRASSKADLREVFRKKRCLPEEADPVFPFESGRTWILEVNPWSSQRLVTAIAAILLQEYVGYDVDLNLVDSTAEVYERLAKTKVAGEALAEHLSAGLQSYGYANLEIWPEGKEQAFRSLGRQAADLGFLGYEGREGWFVANAFAHDPNLTTTPEFYRAYDATRSSSASVIAALKQHHAVNCSRVACCCTDLSSCPAAEEGVQEVEWCPFGTHDDLLPAVVTRSSLRQEGLQEELSRSNGFRFALRFLDEEAYAREATGALQAGAAQVVHAWRPSLLLARLKYMSQPVSRVMLPTEDCGLHLPNASGDWSCDMPRQALQKMASLEVRGDPVAGDFLKRFTLPEASSTARIPGTGLQRTGMRELMAALVEKAQGEARPAEAEEVFDVACRWVKDNEEIWKKWAKPRNVPFFADTLSSGYPLPAILALLIVSVIYFLLMEWFWCSTTLSPGAVRKLLEKNAGRGWRSSLDVRLRALKGEQRLETPPEPDGYQTPPSSRNGSKQPTPESPAAPGGKQKVLRSYSWTPSSSGCHQGAAGLESQRYWMGMGERAASTPDRRTFWEYMERNLARIRANGGACLLEDEEPDDYVYFAKHVFSTLESSEAAVVMLCRKCKDPFTRGSLEVELCVETSDGFAAAGKDFKAGTFKAVFQPGAEFSILRIPVFHHKEAWRNSCWFQVRLVRIVQGESRLATPAKCRVVILTENAWPGNIPDTARDGMGISLMKYFIFSDRVRRGVKWRKTMLAMIWIPVHPVLVSTVVQKVLVDHAARAVLDDSSDGGMQSPWPYYECVLLVLIQLISLGLCRWADIVQTRNRGRTGGIRVNHRAQVLRKFIYMEHSDHWEAPEASWLYSSIHDVDIITTHAYWQVFVFAQSCFALALSVLLILILAFQKQNTGFHPEMVLYPLGVFLIVPLGILGVWVRRKLLWLVIIARKSHERDWFRSYTWVLSHWREFSGVLLSELVSLEKGVKAVVDDFVPLHWDARDSMNDTAWITHWIQGVAYCFMLLLGIFGLMEYDTYGLGAMEVGTFYAFCKVYLGVGKYVGRLSDVFLKMQQAVVSLRELAALMNLSDHGSLRREAKLLQQLSSVGGSALPGHGLNRIVMEENLCFLRPNHSKTGSLFAELRLARRCEFPLGHVVGVVGRNERVLRSVLALAARHLEPTGPTGEKLRDGMPRVLIPPELEVLMVQSMPTKFAIAASSIEEQLALTGAGKELCRKLAGCVGLEPSREISTLGPGSGQVFSILRVILADPDVMVTFRPLNLVPSDVRHKVMVLLRVWQAGGGLPALRAMFEEKAESDVYRSARRTLIVGNADHDLWEGMAPEVEVDVDPLLWRGDLWEDEAAADDVPPPPLSSPPLLLRHVVPSTCSTSCFGRFRATL